MLFDRIYIEEQIRNHRRTKTILDAFPNVYIEYIERFDQIFEKVRKPYLHKRTHLNLFLAKKRGSLVKRAPDAYGINKAPHYYFFHAYNCIYECEYCYLQGYFKSPDIVLFLNHEEVCRAIENTVNDGNHHKEIWFHAGEFSDSLALAHLTQEWPVYWETFKRLPNAYLELRTKSVNIKPLLELEPLPNVIVSFSISPADTSYKIDHKTASVNARIKAIKRLSDRGFNIGLHCDPVIYSSALETEYDTLFKDTFKQMDMSRLSYISIGVVRFTGDVYREFKKNYPESPLNSTPLVKSFDNKIRYNRPMRAGILNSVKKMALKNGVDPEKIYLCMEE